MNKYILLFILIVIVALSSIKAQDKFEEMSKAKASRHLLIYTIKPWHGNLARVKVLVEEKKADIEYTGEPSYGGCTPFLSACGALECLRFNKIFTSGKIDSMEMEAIKIVKYLAKKGANVHAKSLTGWNGLHLAARGGRSKMIPVLVNLGLDVNLQYEPATMGRTPLIEAIVSGDLATVKALVEAGADLTILTPHENSPLDFAVACVSGETRKYPYHDQKAIVEYLKSKGAKHGKNDFRGLWFF